MKFRRIPILCLLLPIVVYSQENDNLKVLFVGNSFTHMWNMPQMIEARAKNQGVVSLVTVRSSVGEVTLNNTGKKKKNTRTRDLLENESWDYVILQDYSSCTIDNPERFTTYGTKLIDLIKEKDAEPLLFMTWHMTIIL